MSRSADSAPFLSTVPGPSSRHSIAESELLYEKLAPLSTRLGLPTGAIRGIATKAAEILQKDGAITNAPSMVISHSGKCPHLVLPKRKSKGLSCDDDCPQSKLCSHVVAAAQHNKELDSFVASYQTLKTVPNITKLATSTMPRGRGHKGSKAPTKRKAAIPVQDRIELHPLLCKASSDAHLHCIIHHLFMGKV